MYASEISDVGVNRFGTDDPEACRGFAPPERTATGSTHRRSTGQARRLQMSP